MSELSIRLSVGAADDPAVLTIWRRAVEATRDFLALVDRDEIEARVASIYLLAVTVSVAEIDDEPVGFAGTLHGGLAMLFVDPIQRGSGVGTALLDHVVAEHGVTKLDVNEQNALAVGFYAHRGVEVVGRSETDEAERPYPLLHLRLSASP